MHYVVAVAGPIGAGKTSLVSGLAQHLPDAVALHIDHYQGFTELPMDAILRWLESGADVDEFSIPLLREHLARLKRGQAVRDPATQMEILPRKYIVFETPFGKLHNETARFIDRLIWIETPLDIALARKLREFTQLQLTQYQPGDDRNFVTWCDGYLANYLQAIGPLMALQRQRVGSAADATLDGRTDLATMIQRAAADVAAHLP